MFRDKCDVKNGLFKPLSHFITEVTLFLNDIKLTFVDIFKLKVYCEV